MLHTQGCLRLTPSSNAFVVLCITKKLLGISPKKSGCILPLDDDFDHWLYLEVQIFGLSSSKTEKCLSSWGSVVTCNVQGSSGHGLELLPGIWAQDLEMPDHKYFMSVRNNFNGQVHKRFQNRLISN